VSSLKGWCAWEDLRPKTQVPEIKKEAKAKCASKDKKPTRPKQTLSEILLLKAGKNTSKLDKTTAFKETVKYINACLPDVKKFGTMITSKKDGNHVLTFTVPGDVDISKILPTV